MMKMIKYIGGLFVCLLVLGSCGDDATPRVTVAHDIDFQVPAAEINPVLLGTLTLPFTTLYQENLAANGIPSNSVTSVTAGKAILRSTFTDVDLGFLQSITVDLVSVDDPQLRKELFYRSNIPINQGIRMDLFSSISELKDIIDDDVNIEILFEYQRNLVIDFRGSLEFTYLIFDE